MAKLAKDLPDVQAEKVDDKGRIIKGQDGKGLTKKFSGQTWKLMGSNPMTNGGWQVKAAETPAEIVETGNLTGATLGDGAGSGVDGEGEESSEGKVGNDIDTTQADDQTPAQTTRKPRKTAAKNDDDEVTDVTAKIV